MRKQLQTMITALEDCMEQLEHEGFNYSSSLLLGARTLIEAVVDNFPSPGDES